ncbi:MAG: type III-A CRISPR-associated RAMP protein Csm3 [Selenomonadaceae bacterium]|nr:type III-A CRISPR-associated RAMP protein Csm3 [Selenomonadaceae bacterium]
MYGKLNITGEIELMTGMHIGGSDAFSAIGAVDSPVVRDARTNQPLLPGSSLKGKLRSLLARAYNTDGVKNHDEDAPLIRRLFGSAGKNQPVPSRLLVSDMFLTEDSIDTVKKQNLSGFTEIKFENTINRLTAVANPRQLERVIRGVSFGLDMIYEVRAAEEITEDFQLLAEGLKMLQYDYLGGHGSRGYGKVRFRNIEVACVVGDVENTDELQNILCQAVVL